MGTTERRERERRRLRDSILEAARELFTQHGYEAVSMRKIAERIEYSPTTIYLYFADKEALVRELCSQDFLALAARFRTLAAEPDPIERLRGIGRAYVRFARERPNHYRMMFMTAHPPVPVADRGIEKGNPQVDAWALLEGTVDEAQRAGLLRRDLGAPAAVAELLMAGVHGVASLHVARRDDPWIPWSPVEQLADRMIEALLRGCGARAAPRLRRRIAKSRR